MKKFCKESLNENSYCTFFVLCTTKLQYTQKKNYKTHTYKYTKL